MFKKIANALNCNYRSIYEPTLYAAEDVMYTLFELDEHYNLPLYKEGDSENKGETPITVGFHYSLLDDFLSGWMKKKKNWLMER